MVTSQKDIGYVDSRGRSLFGRAQGGVNTCQKILYFLSLRPVHLSLLIVIGVAVYSFTLDYPFVFDGRAFVMDNPLIKNSDAFINLFDLDDFISTYLHRLIHPMLATDFARRPVAYLTFYLNYLLGGETPRGFRMFNIAVHISNALMLYSFIQFVIRRRCSEKERLFIITVPFFAALIFLVHPLQTQSVTYIIQRFASLGTFFYLATMLLYLRSSAEGSTIAKRAAYAGSIVMLIMGLLTREDVLTVPFAILLVETILLRKTLREAVVRLSPLILCLGLVPLRLFQLAKEVSEADLVYGISTNLVGGDYSRSEYAITQLRVILSYIRLLLLPYNQNFDPDYPLYRSLLHPEIIVSIMIWFLFIAAGVRLLRRSERTICTDLVAFSIFWFPLAISVSSSFVPLTNLMFEHRTYLPSLAFCTGAAAYIHHLASRREVFRMKGLIAGLCTVALVLIVLTVQRNQVYRSRISLWSDTVSKSPNKYRPYFAMGIVNHDKLRYKRAVLNYKKSLELKPDFIDPLVALGSLYLDQKMPQKTISLYEAYLKQNPPEQRILTNLSLAYAQMGMLQQAIDTVESILQVNSNDASLLSFCSELNLKAGNLKEAEFYRDKAEKEDEIDPTVDLSDSLGELDEMIKKSVDSRSKPLS